jgi:phosphoserine phosphatase
MTTIKRKPRLVLTTDVNGTITPDNTFAEIVRCDGHYDRMVELMNLYTTGQCSFSEVFPKMEKLTYRVNRERIKNYVLKMPLFAGVQKTFGALTSSEQVDSAIVLSTTGFAGLIALMNKYRHGFKLKVAASPALLDCLTADEKNCLTRIILSENDKILILDDLIKTHNPDPGLIFHVGDTLGDFPALVHAVQKGGVGIAFCPNDVLKKRIGSLSHQLRNNIIQIIPKPGIDPDYRHVLDIVAHRLREKTHTAV